MDTGLGRIAQTMSNDTFPDSGGPALGEKVDSVLVQQVLMVQVAPSEL